MIMKAYPIEKPQPLYGIILLITRYICTIVLNLLSVFSMNLRVTFVFQQIPL